MVSSLFLGLCITNAYAVTEQLSASQIYLSKLDSKSNSEIILNNNNPEVKVKALAPNKEIKKSWAIQWVFLDWISKCQKSFEQFDL